LRRARKPIRRGRSPHSAKLQFGSAGAGTTTHLGCALLNAEVGVNVTHVPYRGGAPALNDLMAGQIDYLCSNLGGVFPLITGKKVKAIAMLSRDRSPLMPDLPTAHEHAILFVQLRQADSLMVRVEDARKRAYGS
jgi:tripartite-type tricarboxylate transporter receptor subunit TctC